MADIYERIGARIRELRETAGLSQAKLSDLSGVSTEFLSRLERGLKGCSILTLCRIAEALGVELKNLLDFGRPQDADAQAQRGRRVCNLVKIADEKTAARIERIVEILVGKDR